MQAPQKISEPIMTNILTDSSVRERRCRWCKQNIATDAIVCQNCRNYQTFIRGHIFAISAVITAISAFTAAVIFAWSLLKPDILRWFGKMELELVSFEADSRLLKGETILLYNKSEDNVFISKIQIESRIGSTEINIDRIVEKKSSLLHKKEASPGSNQYSLKYNDTGQVDDSIRDRIDFEIAINWRKNICYIPFFVDDVEKRMPASYFYLKDKGKFIPRENARMTVWYTNLETSEYKKFSQQIYFVYHQLSSCEE